MERKLSFKEMSYLFEMEDLLELRAEGQRLIQEHNLPLREYTKEEFTALWKDLNTPVEDIKITRLAVSEARGHIPYDFPWVDWLVKWCDYWMEEWELSRLRPMQVDYVLFFTLKGQEVFNTKNTSFYECIKYLKTTERSKVRYREQKELEGEDRLEQPASAR